ncbi:MAG: SAM-dependent methyltransferase [Planctomycetes bacterium]|nr:SAM-dependent methyltransferase [Planctomycetota bacterium]
MNQPKELSALDAKYEAQKIAFAPFTFQACRTLKSLGVLGIISDSRSNGISLENIIVKTGVSEYGSKVLLDMAVCLGVVHLNESGLYTLGKVGYFLLRDKLTEVNMDFTHDVCYKGLFDLEEAIRNGKPSGLKVFGEWQTIYEALSQLPEQVQKSWFDFDHYYSDTSFPEALPFVFRNKPGHLFDIGGNTGKWTLQCLEHNEEVQVTILDLPGQLNKAINNIEEKGLSDRVNFHEIDLLSETKIPTGADAIWMSQFLDCFSGKEIVSILKRACASMSEESELFIMETYWNRQKYPAAEFSLHATSLYFTCMANGNSRMYHSDDMKIFVEAAGLKVIEEEDDIGVSHTLFRCKKA